MSETRLSRHAAIGRRRLKQQPLELPPTTVYTPDGKEIQLPHKKNDEGLVTFQKLNPKVVNPRTGERHDKRRRVKLARNLPLGKLVVAAVVIYKLAGWIRQRWFPAKQEEVDEEHETAQQQQQHASQQQQHDTWLEHYMMRSMLPGTRRPALSHARQLAQQQHNRKRPIPNAYTKMHPTAATAAANAKAKLPSSKLKLMEQIMRQQALQQMQASWQPQHDPSTPTGATPFLSTPSQPDSASSTNSNSSITTHIFSQSAGPAAYPASMDPTTVLSFNSFPPQGAQSDHQRYLLNQRSQTGSPWGSYAHSTVSSRPESTTQLSPDIDKQDTASPSTSSFKASTSMATSNKTRASIQKKPS